MQCGISTACFYPAPTLDALRMVADTGAPVTEIFMNTFSELEDAYVSQLEAVVRQTGIRVSSIHPFSSMLEGFLFASAYEGRLQDGLALYEKYFALCRRLGADKLVFHGDHRVPNRPFPVEAYARRFCKLAELGLQYGVQLCHENVFYCRLATPADVAQCKPLLGPYAAFVLDMKQARRSGAGVWPMLDAMGAELRHIHISDGTPADDCLPPGEGDFDFAAFTAALAARGYRGDLIIELYRDGFCDTQELVAAMDTINALLAPHSAAQALEQKG